MIQLSKPNLNHLELQAVKDVLDTGYLVHGDQCLNFENEIAHYLNAKHTSVVSSATAGLHLALLALNIQKGNKVIVPGFTFPATINVVEIIGAEPVILDINIDDYNLDINVLEEYLVSNTDIKAIIIVHEFGCPADIEKIIDLSKKYNFKIIEDAACAFGAEYNNKKVGSLENTISCFSFHPRKALTTGEGGAITCNDKTIIDKINSLKNHGISIANGKIEFSQPGLNYRITNFQSAIGRVQLQKFPKSLEIRNKLTEIYFEQLNGTSEIKLPNKTEGHSWQTFMIILNDKIDRDIVIKELKKINIESNIGAYSLLQLNYYSKYNNAYSTPTADLCYRSGLALPLHEQLKAEEIVFICEKLKGIINKWK